MTGRPWEKYQKQPAQPPVSSRNAPRGGSFDPDLHPELGDGMLPPPIRDADYAAGPSRSPTAKPWEKYAGSKPQTQPKNGSLVDDIMQGAVGQIGQGILTGAASLPGLPVDAVAGLSNFISRNTGGKEVPVEESGLAGWGGQGWVNALVPEVNNGRIPQGTLAGKAGQFLGGGAALGGIAGAAGLASGGLKGLVSGVAAPMVPSATAFVGSEVGKVADQVAPDYTKGYGEFAGGVIGGAAPGIKSALTRQPIKTPAPTPEEINAAKTAAYKAADDAGVIYDSSGIGRLRAAIEGELADKAFQPQMQPGVAIVLDELAKIEQGGPVTLKGLDTLRKMAGNAGRSADRTQNMMAGDIVRRIDEFINNPAAAEVIGGDAAAGAAAIKNARKLAQTSMKAEKIQNAVDDAILRAESTGSGGNVDNAIRQNLRRFLTKSNKESKGWTVDEKAMLRKVVRGAGLGQKIARQLGKVSPEGSGLMTGMFGGGAIGLGSPQLLAPLGIGFVAKRIADSATHQNVNALLDTVRRGGVAYGARQPMRMLTPSSASGVPGAIQSKQR